MKKYICSILLVVPVLFAQPVKSQDVYAVSSWESLFQWADIAGTPQSSQNINERLRYTFFLNAGQYWHMDFINNLGLYSGLSVRNVGFIYDTDLPTKTIRRSYNVGVPLALKIGVFDKNFYLFGGGEYELLFLYKGKRWLSNDRNGTKLKDTEWFSAKTERLVPSWFVGIQLPGGFNIKYKQYLGDFINTGYVGQDLGDQSVSFANYSGTKVQYISVCWQFRTDQWRKYIPVDDKVAYRD